MRSSYPSCSARIRSLAESCRLSATTRDDKFLRRGQLLPQPRGHEAWRTGTLDTNTNVKAIVVDVPTSCSERSLTVDVTTPHHLGKSIPWLQCCSSRHHTQRAPHPLANVARDGLQAAPTRTRCETSDDRYSLCSSLVSKGPCESAPWQTIKPPPSQS